MYIFINEEIISLENIMNISKDEENNLIRIVYLINERKVDYYLDYSERKIKPNEKETDLQKDFKKLKNKLCRKEKNV